MSREQGPVEAPGQSTDEQANHSQDALGEWIFQQNIAGLTLLLFAAGYIGQHLAVLMPVSGSPKILLHYMGELVLTGVSFGYALWRAYGASEPYRQRVGFLKRSPIWYYIGLAAVALNLVLLTTLLVLGRLA